MNFPAPKLGEQIRRYIDERLRKFMLSERVVSGNGILIKQTSGGRTISAIVKPMTHVRIAGRRVAISGAVARYVWIDVSAGTATFSSTDMDPMPDGIEIVDTHANEFHIPRLG